MMTAWLTLLGPIFPEVTGDLTPAHRESHQRKVLQLELRS